MPGCKRLRRGSRQVIGFGDVTVHPPPEAAPAKLLDLDLVLAADISVPKDEDVVQVAVRVREREVGRAREERRARERLSLAIVPENELLVEDDRVVVPPHLDVGA
jgi:hypothetical protein